MQLRTKCNPLSEFKKVDLIYFFDSMKSFDLLNNHGELDKWIFSMKNQCEKLRKMVTLCCILLRSCYFGLKTRVIIKIEFHLCCPSTI